MLKKSTKIPESLKKNKLDPLDDTDKDRNSLARTLNVFKKTRLLFLKTSLSESGIY